MIFSPFYNRRNLTNFKVLFCKIWNNSTSCFHSHWLKYARGMCKNLKDMSAQLPQSCKMPWPLCWGRGQSGGSLEILSCFLSPCKPVHTSSLTVFNWQILAAELKNVHLVGGVGFSEGMSKDKRVNDITGFHCVVGHSENI